MSDRAAAMKLCDAYIAEHAGEVITREMLAEMTNYSISQFSRIFREYHEGMNLREYLYHVRAEKAEILLTQGWRVSSIAKAAGFGSYDSMLRGFHHVYGKSISAYMRDYISKQREERPVEKLQIVQKDPIRCIGYLFRDLKPEGLLDTLSPWIQADFTTLPAFPEEMRQDTELSFWIGEPGREGSSYFFGVTDETTPCPEGFFEYQLPAATWAVFNVTDHATINSTKTTGYRTMVLWDYVRTGWFASEESAGWEMREDLNFAVCYSGMNVWLWVPVRESGD